MEILYLAAAAARTDAADILGNGDLLGRTLDTFVAAQLRPEVALHPAARMHPLQTEAGRQEVDLLVDLVHTDAQPFPLDDRIWALPIWTVWSDVGDAGGPTR